jgi:hypothetical protein
MPKTKGCIGFIRNSLSYVVKEHLLFEKRIYRFTDHTIYLM